MAPVCPECRHTTPAPLSPTPTVEEVDVAASRADASRGASAGSVCPSIAVASEAMAHPVRYTQVDGLNIAYQVVGDGPIDLVMVDEWSTPLEGRWDVPAIAGRFPASRNADKTPG